jgi:hypothetical protein
MNDEVARMLGIEPEPPTPIKAQSAPTADPLAFLNGIGEAKKPGKTKSYPIYPDTDGAGRKLANRIIQLADAKDELESCSKLLGGMVTPAYFAHASGKPEPESSMKVVGNEGSVLVTFKKQTKKMSDGNAIAPLKPMFAGREKDLFFFSFDLKIDSDEIPAASQPAFVAELTQLLAKHGASPKALAVERQFKPSPAFYVQRHTLFTTEQNLEINRTLPVIVSVKTKGVS